MRKKFCSFLAVALIMAMCTPVAFAANTTDTTWNYTVSNSYRYTTLRAKENSTPVYTQYKTGSYERLAANVASNSYEYHTYLADGSHVYNVYVHRGVQQSIHNDVYESGVRSCFVGFATGDSQSFAASGVWSPDSTRTYTSATEY